LALALDLDSIIAQVVRAGATGEQQEIDPQIDLDAIISSVQARGAGRPGLTIVSNGLGRDSATIIALLVAGNLLVDGERVLPKDVDAVVFSDTGYEWDFSYSVIPVLTKMLAKVGVPFYVLRKPPEEQWRPYIEAKRKAFIRAWEQSGGDPNSAIFRKVRDQMVIPPPWVKEQWESLAAKAQGGGYHRAAPLMQEFAAYKRMNMRSSPQCTDRHKIQPINALIEDLTLAKYGMTLKEWGQGVLRGENQQHRVLIGFAADEVDRVARGGRAILTAVLVRPKTGGAGALKHLGFTHLSGGVYEVRLQAEDVQPMLTALERNGYEKVPWRKGPKSRLSKGDYRIKLGKVWKRELYPLWEMGITKADESAILKTAKLDWIRKSGCLVCHFQPVEWFVALAQVNPAVYQQVLAYEQLARSRNPKWYLKGSKPLDVQVRAWRQAHPTVSVQQILDKNYDRCGAFNLRPNAHIPVLIPA
jgi:hypothetical protein